MSVTSGTPASPRLSRWLGRPRRGVGVDHPHRASARRGKREIPCPGLRHFRAWIPTGAPCRIRGEYGRWQLQQAVERGYGLGRIPGRDVVTRWRCRFASALSVDRSGTLGNACDDLDLEVEAGEPVHAHGGPVRVGWLADPPLTDSGDRPDLRDVATGAPGPGQDARLRRAAGGGVHPGTALAPSIDAPGRRTR